MRPTKILPVVSALVVCCSICAAQSLFWLPTSGPENAEVTWLEEGANGLLIAATSQGVFVSADRGEHWSKTLNVAATAVLRHADNYLLAATASSGIYASSKNGALWSHLPGSPDTIWALARDERGRIYAGGTGTVAISRDKGLTWQSVTIAGTEVSAFVFKPHGRVWAATNGDGIFFSPDTGQTWHSMPNGLEDLRVQDLALAHEGQFYSATRTGVFKSTDNGLSWARASPDWGVTVHKLAITHGGTVVAATHNGVYVSRNQGVDWTQESSGLTNTVTGALLSTAQDGLYVGTWGSGVFRSSEKPDGFNAVWLSGERPGDGFGYSLAKAGDVNGDGWQDFVVGAPYADTHGPSSGAAYLYFGGPTLLAHDPVLLTAPVTPFAGFGYSVAGVGDVNADGYDDIVVGAPRLTETNGEFQSWSTESGFAYLYFGGPLVTGVPDVVLEDIYGFGACVTGAGDVNSDGFKDFAVASIWEPSGPVATYGIIHVYLGAAGRHLLPGPQLTPFRGDFVYMGRKTIGAGDYNHDGYDDIATNFTWDRNTWGLSLYRGGSPMDSISDKVMYGDRLGDEGTAFPRALTSGDINGDGSSDIVGASGSIDLGPGTPRRIVIYLGGTSMSGSGTWRLYQPQHTVAYDDTVGYGEATMCAGDPNGDGFDDIVVGTPRAATHGLESGGAYFYRGGNPLPPDPYLEVPGGMKLDRAGTVIAGAADFDGDGIKEILLSAQGTDSTIAFPGRVYLAKLAAVPPLSPGVPQLVGIPDGATEVPLTFRLWWHGSPHTQWYEFQVTEDSIFSGSGWHNAHCTDTSQQFEALSGRTHTLFWRVRASNKAGTSSWSEVRRFTTTAGVVGTAQLIAPPDSAFVDSSSIRLVWQNCNYSGGKYWVEVSADPQFTSAMCDTSLTDTTKTITGFSRGQSYWWRVKAHNGIAWGPFSASRKFTVRLTVVPSGPEDVPSIVMLAQNYPNPFNPVTNIRFGLPGRMQVTMTIYSILGQQIANLLEGTYDAGYHAVSFSAANLPSGMYFYRLEVRPLSDESPTGGTRGISILTRKLTVVR